jgi:hypothetical protein
MDMSIDPVLAPKWNLFLTIKFDDNLMNLSRIYKRAIRDWGVLQSFNPFLDPVGTEVVLPGTFKSDYGNMRSTQSQDAGILNYFVDGGDLKEAVSSLFSNAKLVPSITFKKTCLNDMPFCSTQQLISLLKFKGVTVPYESLLWKFSERLLDSCGSKSSLLKFNTGMIALLKGIWEEFVHEIGVLWQAGLYIPGIDVQVYDEERNEYTLDVGIDLDHNIMHQKLAMINCCLYRKCLIIPTYDARIELQNTARKLNSISSLIKPLFNTTHVKSMMFDTLSGIADFRISESDLISKVLPKYSLSNNPTLHSAELPIPPYSKSPDSYMSDTNHQFGSSVISKVSVLEGTSWSSDKSWERFNAPQSLKNEEELNIKILRKYPSNETKFMAESFIQHSELNVSKTLIPPTSEITTIQEFTSSDRVGHSKILEGLFMISNGEPIWEPLTQMPFLMTEDMLQEQESLFTSLGTSSKGTERRAKIQSAQLISGIND